MFCIHMTFWEDLYNGDEVLHDTGPTYMLLHVIYIYIIKYIKYKEQDSDRNRDRVTN